MKQEVCVIIGASHAAAALAPELRKQGWQGRIVVIGDEEHLPYHHPPLSKEFLAGEKEVEDLLIRPERIYQKHAIEFKLGCRVNSINRQSKTVTLDNNEVIDYSKLALCTGSRARKIPLPGSDLKGVHYLRSIDDVQKIKADIQPNSKTVIIGGGYIGLETAAVLRKLGMEVTVLEMLPRILARVTAPELSNFYTRVHQAEGVNIHCDVMVEACQGNDLGHVERVICKGGAEYQADLVIIGAGIVPNVELAEQAGLAVENGITVDEYAQTSDPDIVAAGDCTNHPNKLIGKRIRLESVPNASEQAKSAAASLCDQKRDYNQLPWFWSDQYNYKLQIAGLNTGYDETLVRGDLEEGTSFVVYYLSDGKLLAADCINRPKEFLVAKKILTEGIAVDTQKLIDESIDPKEFLVPA